MFAWIRVSMPNRSDECLVRAMNPPEYRALIHELQLDFQLPIPV